MVIKTDAIVLRTMKYRDTSLIATLYTRDLGRISVIAKGVREKASRFGGLPDVTAQLAVVLYWHEGRDLQLMSRWELETRTSHITDSMERIAVAFGAIELIDAVSHHEEARGSFYSLLANVLDAANGAPRNIASLLPYFQMQVLAGLGFRPGIVTCRVCGRDLSEGEIEGGGVSFEPERGSVVCFACRPASPGERYLSGGALRTLQRLLRFGSANDVAELAMIPCIRQEVSSALQTLLLTHVEGTRPSKSEAVFASLA